MSTAVSSWTCPQCGRRVPGRAPLCHCGSARAAASLASSRSALGTASAVPPAPGTTGWLPVLAAVAGMCVVAALVLAAARAGAPPRDAPTSAGPRMRGPAGYPALPAAPTMKAGHGTRGAARTLALPPGMTPLAPASLRPATAAEQDWAKTTALLDLPLRKIAADSSVLELSYRPFAEACVDGARGPGGGEWLLSLRRAALRPGVTLRDAGVTVDCETARAHLMTRADALKADLAATEKVAEASHVPPEHWRTLLATHDLSGWQSY
jgi:hypothetical protein